MHISVYLLIPSFEFYLDDLDEKGRETAIITKCEQVFGVGKDSIKLCGISNKEKSTNNNSVIADAGHIKEGCFIRNSGLTLDTICTTMQRNQDLYTFLHKTSDSLIALQKQREQDSDSFTLAHNRVMSDLDRANANNRDLSAQVNKLKMLNNDLEKMLENSEKMRRETMAILENMKKQQMVFSRSALPFTNVGGLIRAPHTFGGYRPPLAIGGPLRPTPPLSPKPRNYSAPTPRRRIVPRMGNSTPRYQSNGNNTNTNNGTNHLNGIDEHNDNTELVVTPMIPKPPYKQQQQQPV